MVPASTRYWLLAQEYVPSLFLATELVGAYGAQLRVTAYTCFPLASHALTVTQSDTSPSWYVPLGQFIHWRETRSASIWSGVGS